MDTKISLPENVVKIIAVLNEGGYEAYAVGGCVRDSIMLREPKDWDITTSAQPCQVMKHFPHVIQTGIMHGTVTVLYNRTGYEVTTFRLDGDYSDGRHPSFVTYTSLIEQDLMRRDFTVNAIAYHPDKGLVDPYGGLQDIEAKLLRTVGEPDTRFGEDALRMLRAVRFSAQLGFGINEDVLVSIKRCRKLIKQISMERIREELTGTLVSGAASDIILLYKTGLMDEILPELSDCFSTGQHHPFHIYNVGEHSLKAVENIERETLLRWVMLLHDVGKPRCKTTDSKGIDHFYGHPLKSAEIANGILERLRFDKTFIKNAVRLVKYHDMDILPDRLSVKKAILKVGDDLFPSLLKVAEADKKAQNPDKLDDQLEAIYEIRQEYERIKNDGDCLSLKELAVSGDDLKKLGIIQGQRVGNLLTELFEHVIKYPADNRREILLELAVKLIRIPD